MVGVAEGACEGDGDGDFPFCGVGDGFGVGDFAGVGDLAATDGDAFVFAFARGVGFATCDGEGDGRSVTGWAPRPRAAPACEGVAEGFTCGLIPRKDFCGLGVGVGVGVDAARSEAAHTSKSDKQTATMRIMCGSSDNKAQCVGATSKRINFCARVDTTRARCFDTRPLALEKIFARAQILRKIDIMPSTEIILTEPVAGLGAEADVVKVRRGFARNYLLPRGKAHEVTPAAMRQLDHLKKKRAEREARELNDAEEIARRINKSHLTFTLETGESGKAFGSITAQDIMNRLKNELGVEIDRHKIDIEHPIKSTGEHAVTIKLHHEVAAQLNFTVKSSESSKQADAAPADEEQHEKKRSFFRRKKES